MPEVKTLAFNTTTYLKSATKLSQMPADSGSEIAFIGRSNAGKSSSINTITSIKGLARTSQTPGRTQMINIFEIAEGARLIDLPGYGYAKVPKIVRERWEKSIDQYLQERKCLRGLVLIMDIRHPLKEIDMQLIDWATTCDLPVHILLSKSDKLSKNEQRKAVAYVESHLSGLQDLISIQLFSSLKKDGVTEARAQITAWLTSS
jgi:GTP-binding protein